MAKTAETPFSASCLRGRVALVTGGGSGIGFEIARQLGLHGAAVVIMGRRESFLSRATAALAREGISASHVVGDVRERKSAEEAVGAARRRHDRLDILVNGAAGNFLANAAELTLKGFKTVLEIDTVGVFNMSTAAHDLLRESGDACIINISMTLHYGATWYQAHASAAKAAIDSLTRSLALEWGRFGIRVLGIAPGPIANTPGMAKLSPGLSAQAAQAIPLGRMGSTWDVAMTAVFFCTAGAGYVTGDTLVVDGGEWLAKPALAPPEAISKLSRAAEAKSRALGPGASSARSRL